MDQTLMNLSQTYTDIFCCDRSYAKRILSIQDDVLQLSRPYKHRDDHLKLYKNIVRDGFGDVIEVITPDISIEEYIQLFKERFLVYEIFDYIENTKKIELVHILIYYPESKTCFFYKTKNRYHVMLFGFFFEKIIRDIDKEELDNLFLNKTRTLQHEKLLETQPYRVSNIMNPDGFVQFPRNMETAFENYVNRTNKPYPPLNAKFFRNYLWVHYHTMKPIEARYIPEIERVARETLMRTELGEEMVNYIVSHLEN